MKVWKICVASALSATATGITLFLPTNVLSLSPPQLARLASTQWSAIAVVWLVIYSLAAATLTILVTLLNTTQVSDPITTPKSLADTYIRLLLLTQFFTAIAAVLTFYFSGIPVFLPHTLALRTDPFAASAALVAAGLSAFLGVVGLLVVAAAQRIHNWVERRHTSPSVETRELRLLQDVASMLRQAPHAATAQVADIKTVAEAVEQLQRSLLEAIKELATALNRRTSDFHRKIDEVKTMVRGYEAAALPDNIGTMLSELRQAVMSLSQEVDRLQDSQGLGRLGHPVIAKLVPPSLEARAQLSAELRDVLLNMTSADPNLTHGHGPTGTSDSHPQKSPLTPC